MARPDTVECRSGAAPVGGRAKVRVQAARKGADRGYGPVGEEASA